MDYSLTDVNRHLIPRLRSLNNSSRTGELSVPYLVNNDAEKDVIKNNLLLYSWHEDKSVENAAELLIASIISDCENSAIDAANYLLEKKKEVVPSIIKLASELICRHSNILIPNSIESRDTNIQEKYYATIHKIRSKNREALFIALADGTALALGLAVGPGGVRHPDGLQIGSLQIGAGEIASFQIGALKVGA